MKRYLVWIQVIEVWHIEVEANSKNAAKQAAYDLNVKQIRERGELENIETDHAAVLEELKPEETQCRSCRRKFGPTIRKEAA